ncbi:MAG: tetratricopeptide repeat protein [Verrucomicrobia bacterium]|nr:tetratricopeptide repeat protein [Verrucomicrobiota bacterium]
MRTYLNILVAVLLTLTFAVSCGRKKEQAKPGAKDPKTAAEYVRRAKGNFLAKEKAIRDCNKAIELDPEYFPAYEFRAECYTELHAKTDNVKHARKAIADYDRLVDLKLAPEAAADYLRKRGLIKMKIEDLDGAIKDFQAAGKTKKDEPRTYEYLAQAFLAKNDPERAVKAYAAAIKYEPRNIAHFKARAAIYRQMGDSDNAIKDLMEVVRIGPDNATYIALGEIYQERGDRLAAIDWFDKVKEEED